MPESIFFLPGKQKEDALTHTFLSVLERLSPSIRSRLLHECELRDWSNDNINSESTIEVEIRTPLADRSIPDAIIRIPSSGLVVVFENKLGQQHTTEQLGKYYNQVSDEKRGQNIRIIAAIDARTQSRFAVRSIAEEAGIPEGIVDTLVWQDVNAACTGIVTDAAADKTKILESDLLLLQNLISFMEELGLIPFKGLTSRELNGYVKSKGELELLDRYLRQQVPLLLPELETYATQSEYGKISGSWLGFPFKRAQGTGVQSWTFLFVQLIIEGLNIGIALGSDDDRKIIFEHIEMEELVDALIELSDYSLMLGDEEGEETDPNKLLDIDTEELLPMYIEVSRIIDFETLENNFGLNSPQFPVTIAREVQKLSRVVEMIDSAMVS